jgi:hypothetical protein
METEFPSGSTLSHGTNTKSHYVYEGLNALQNEVRFLRVLPSAPGGLIRCEMIRATLDKHPSYEAVSYTWGDGEATHPIYLDGKVFMVRENLMIAMQHLRYKWWNRILWIDAVCIDQANVVERSEQVLQMRRIYKQASHVLIWLGVEGPDGNLLRFFGRLGFFHVMKDFGKFPNISLAAVVRLLRRPWFERVWVVQEVAVARHAIVLCGKHEIKWSNFIKGIRSYELYVEAAVGRRESQWNYMAKSTGNYEPIRALEGLLEPAHCVANHEFNAFTMEMFRNVEDPRLQIQLEDVIEYMRICKATEPKDRVYAALGIIPLKKAEIIPDYTKDIASVYRQAARSILLESRSLDLLRHCQPGSTLRLASWMPDWSQPRTTPLIVSVLSRSIFLKTDYLLYNGFRGGGSEFAIDTVSDSLHAKGVHVSTIQEIELSPGDNEIKWQQAAVRCGTGPFFEDLTSRPIKEEIAMTLEESQMRSLAYRSGGSVADAFALTLMMYGVYGAIDDDTINVGVFKKCPRSVYYIEAVHEMHRGGIEDLYEAELAGNISSYEFLSKTFDLTLRNMAVLLRKEISVRISGRGFFVSEDKHMGLCTTYAKPGDAIVLLDGMVVPLILRKAEDGDYYTVIGEACKSSSRKAFRLTASRNHY